VWFNYVILPLMLAVNLKAYSQQGNITLRDARTHNPIAFAHVIFEEAQSGKRTAGMSDMNGMLPNPVTLPSTVMATYVGYRTYTGNIAAGASLEILLEPVVYNIDEVVVTGQYTPQRVDKSIYRVRVIGAKQIEQKASNNLSELLAGELNIRASHDGALGSRITLQGLGGEHVKFLIDGVPVIGRMNGNIDLGQLNLYNVEHIEVIEGPMSVIYGSNALAGVVNIITRENKHTTYSSNATAYYESVGTYNFNADASVRKGRWSGSLAGARNFFEGFNVVDTTRSKRWKPKRQYNLDGGIQYRHEDLRIRFTTAYFNELLLDKGNLMQPYFETAFDSYFYTSRLTSKLDLNTKLFKNRYLNLIASYSYYDRTKNTYFKDLTTLNEVLTANPMDHDTSTFNQYLMRAEFSKSTDDEWFNYQLGIDLNYEDGFGKRILNQKQAIGDYAAFVSAKLKPSRALMLQPGLRVSHNTKYKSPLVYSLNLKYDFNELLSFRASYAKGFRAPSLKELYLEFVDVNHNIRGNENLKAEDSRNINLAVRYHQEKSTYDWGIELSLFHNNISNSISLATVDWEEGLYTYVNVDNMITQGFQFNFNNRIYPWLQLQLGIGETGRKQIMSGDLNNKFIYSTDVIANVNYLWQKPNLSFSAYYKYNGAYPEVFIGQGDQVFRTIMSAYNTLDFAMSRWFWRNRVNVQVGAKNLFNNTNISISGDTGGGGIHTGGTTSAPVGWGRTYFVKLSMSMKQF
jgi:outer membrane receptor for ferrienterochelin and colicins